MARTERKIPRSVEFSAKHILAEFFEDKIENLKQEISCLHEEISDWLQSGSNDEDWSIKYRKDNLMLREKEIEILDELLSDL